VITIDVPGSRSGTRGERDVAGGYERDRLYVEQQLRELITQLEQITGTRFDVDRLRETIATPTRWAAPTALSWENRTTPAVFDAVLEGTTYLGVANALRGTAAGTQYFTGPAGGDAAAAHARPRPGRPGAR
jgi:benzoyl-CoA reductase subunit B